METWDRRTICNGNGSAEGYNGQNNTPYTGNSSDDSNEYTTDGTKTK